MSIDLTRTLSMETEFAQVSKDLSTGWGSSRVRIIKDPKTGSVEARTKFHILQLLFDFLACLFPSWYNDENRATIDYFYKIFGQKRVLEISKKYDLDIDVAHTHGLALSKSETRDLMTGLAVVRLEDIQEIFNEFQKDSDQCFRHLNHVESESARERFYNREFDDLTNGEMRLLQRIAAPHMTSRETVFLHDVPNFSHPGFDRGRTLHGLGTAVCDLFKLQELTDRGDYTLKERQRLADIITAKHLLGPNSTPGMMIFQPEGVRVLHEKFQGGGAYGVYLKALKKTENFRNQVLFFCTQFDDIKHTWEAAVEDLKENIGAVGAISVFNEVHDMVTNRFKGFIDRSGEKVDFVGFSLGGAQASRIVAALAHEKCVRRLTTYASPKIDYLTERWFQEMSERIEIVEMRDHGDVTPLNGDISMGSSGGEHPYELHYISKGAEDAWNQPEIHGNPFDVAHRVWTAIQTCHGSVPTLEDTFTSTENRKFIKDHCDNAAHGVEPVRKPFARAFDEEDRFFKWLHDLYARNHWPVTAGVTEIARERGIVTPTAA